MITERLMGSGQWSIQLSPSTPGGILDVLDPVVSAFSHIVVTPTTVDPTALGDAGVLSLARYTGVYRKKSGLNLSGAGAATWLGDESGKGDVLPSATATTFATWVSAIRPSYMSAGTVSTISGTLSKTFLRVTRRQALDEVCAFYNAEWRVRPDFTLDVGTRAALFRTTPRAVVVKRKVDAGMDSDLVGLPGDLTTDVDVEDWVRSVLFYFDNNSQSHEANGSVANANVPYRNPTGGPAVIRKVIESSTGATSEAASLAASEYAAVKDPRRTLTLNADVYDIGQDVAVGDDLWVYDPDAGLVDTSNVLQFRGEGIFPAKIRCVGYTWPVRLGMGVYLRRYVKISGVWTVEWIDLTQYVEWEDGDGAVEVGASPNKVAPSRSATGAPTAQTTPYPTREEYGKALVDRPKSISGTVTITPSGAGTATSAVVPFPVGAFTVAPNVIAGVSSPNATVGVSAISATGFTATIIRNTTTNTVVTWQAFVA